MTKKLMRVFGVVRHFIKINKVKSAIIAILAVLALFWLYSKIFPASTETTYVFSTVKMGDIVTSISGSGQLAASNQVDLKSKVSGDVAYINVQEGDVVKAGTLILQINSREAEKAVRDAEVNLQSAKLSYQKTTEPADTLSLVQAENALAQANTNVEKSYNDSFSSVSDTFMDLPTVMTGVYDLLYGTNINKANQQNVFAYADMVKNYDERVLQFRDDTMSRYDIAKKSYDSILTEYRETNRFSDKEKLEKLVADSYETTKTVSEAIKSANDYLGFVKYKLTERNQAVPAILTTHQSQLSGFTDTANNHLTSLLSSKDSITSSRYALAEKTESLKKIKDGATAIDIASSELSVKQRQNALLDAKEKLADYYIRAPFDATVAKISIKKTDNIGSGTVVATLITKEKTAQISLNEVDIAKIKVGQKVNLDFDALDGFSLTGKVVEIDSIGTVSQGVVTYNVKISLDADDIKIKPGMSVSANIITDVKPNVLNVPNSAIKILAGRKYVEIKDPDNPDNPAQVKKVFVETGLSNDTNTEIVQGLADQDLAPGSSSGSTSYTLKQGDRVVTRTITAAAKTTTQTPSILNSIGGNRAGGTGGAGGTGAGGGTGGFRLRQ